RQRVEDPISELSRRLGRSGSCFLACRHMTHRRRRLYLAGLLLAAAVHQSCNRSPSPAVATRPYYLAFTPFAYLPGDAAVKYTVARIASDADMIADHIGDFGVPW